MHEFLRDIEIFRGVSASTLQGIAAAVEEMSLPADTYLFREGEPADALFIIRAGSVRVVQPRPATGGSMVIMQVAAGAVVGETGVLGGTCRAASVLTNTPSVFWKLPRSAFQVLAASDPLLRSRLQTLANSHMHPMARQGLTPEGEEGIRLVGHRDYVGGLWEEIGQLQCAFLVAQGLKSFHCLLDIGCGALRGGVHFIRYLDPGNYLGLEKEKTLIELGVDKELGVAVYQQKQAEFVISACFAWKATYIGDWEHPRHQMMLQYDAV